MEKYPGYTLELRSINNMEVEFIAKKTWDSITLIDSKIQKNSLKDTFSKMVLDGDQIRTPTYRHHRS